MKEPIGLGNGFFTDLRIEAERTSHVRWNHAVESIDDACVRELLRRLPPDRIVSICEYVDNLKDAAEFGSDVDYPWSM
jgi:hypothetical protein